MGLALLPFVGLWVVMMAAMMLPSVAPVAVLWTRLLGGAWAGAGRVVRLSLFLGGYLLAWAGFGAAAFAALAGTGRLVTASPAAAEALGVAIFSAAGIYQLTRWKDWCLRRCRSPVGTLMHDARVKGRERPVLRIRTRNDAAVLAATEEDLDELIAFVAAEANHEPSRRRRQRLDAALDALTTAAQTRGRWRSRPPQPGPQRCDPDPAAAGMSYRLGMPARKRATPEDAVTARRVLLGGLGDGAELFGLLGALEPLHPRNDTFPGEVFLHLAADALDWCGASRAGPLPLAGIRERFLPECRFRGRQHNKLQFAVLAAAALHGGTEPDLLDEIAWWQTDDFWEYALFAAVAYIRAAASQADVPIAQACQELALRPADPAP